MTDREMLELAALAAGYDSAIEMYGLNEIGEPLLDANDPPTVWNPRDDDGDSRRLEVKLGITNTKTLHEAMQSVEDWSDPCAATRLAVLRVAAEIGRQMKEQQP